MIVKLGKKLQRTHFVTYKAEAALRWQLSSYLNSHLNIHTILNNPRYGGYAKANLLLHEGRPFFS